MLNEFWLPILGYEDQYAVSDLGRVKSLSRTVMRKNGSPISVRTKVLKPGTTAAGYPLVVLAKKGKTKSFTVHGLVLRAFTKSPAADVEVDHRNQVRSDNRLSNLRWGTRRQNCGNSNWGNGESGMRGVTKRSDTQWVAKIAKKHIGSFKTKEAAGRAYDKAAKEHFGEFAKLNFPENEGIAP